MTDTRYPDALDMSETPEFETPQQEIAYWKGLALSYGAKLRAVEVVMGRTWTAKFDPATESVVVIGDAAD